MCWFECFLLRLVVGLFAVGTRCLSGFHNKTSSAHSTESQGFALQQVSHLQRPQNPQSPQWWWDASADLCPKFSGGQSESGDKKLFGLFSRKSLITIPQNQIKFGFLLWATSLRWPEQHKSWWRRMLGWRKTCAGFGVLLVSSVLMHFLHSFIFLKEADIEISWGIKLWGLLTSEGRNLSGLKMSTNNLFLQN